MNKTLFLIAASAAAVFTTPASAAVDIAPSSQSHFASSEVFADSAEPVLEETSSFKKRRSFRRGHRARSHRGFRGRHRGFSHRRGFIGKKRHFKHDVKRFRHRDRFHAHDRRRHNGRFVKHDGIHHDGHSWDRHHDHHDGTGKIVVKKKDIVFHPHG